MRASSSSTTKKARVAILVDCDSFSPEILDFALLRAGDLGRVVVRRCYGNPGVLAVRWRRIMTRLAFAPCLQFQTIDETSASISLTTEAMEMMFDERADIFCLVTCNSGFTMLCHKLRERGVSTCIIGDQRVSSALRGVCDSFFEWEEGEQHIIVPAQETITTAAPRPQKKPLTTTASPKPAPAPVKTPNGTLPQADAAPATDLIALKTPKASQNSATALSRPRTLPPSLNALPSKKMPPMFPGRYPDIMFYESGGDLSAYVNAPLNYTTTDGPLSLVLPRSSGLINFSYE